MGCYDSKPVVKSRCAKRGRRPVTFSGLNKGGRGVPVPAAVGVTRSESVIDERVRNAKVRPRGASPPTPGSPSVAATSNIIFSIASPSGRQYANDERAIRSCAVSEPISLTGEPTEYDRLDLHSSNHNTASDNTTCELSLVNPLPTTLLVVYEGVNKNSSERIIDGENNSEGTRVCSTAAEASPTIKAGDDAMTTTGSPRIGGVALSPSPSAISARAELILMCVDCGIEINEDSENSVCMLTGKLHG